jgi:hypothetical protein
MMGGKSTSTTSPKLNGLQVQSSTLGLPISLGWGRGRMKCNLVWYNAFTAIPHTTKTSAGKGLGGGSKNTTYTYTASIILGICEGGASGIQGIRTIYKDTAVLTTLSAAGLSLATGAATQPVWGYLTSKFPAQAINYSGIAYVYAQDYDLADSATLSNHSFEIDFATQLGGSVCDADPKDIITDFLTNAAYGVPMWGSGLIGDLSDYSLYCRANNLLLSPVLESQSSAASILEEWLTATNAAVFWSEGMLKIRPYGDAAATGNSVTWTPNLTPVYDLTEDDLAVDDSGNAVSIEIVDQSDAYNIVQFEFLDRSQQYNVGIATAQDLDNIVTYGRRKQDPTTVHCICDAAIARKAVQLYGQRVLYTREKYTFKLPWNFALLEPTDLVTLTTTTDSLSLKRVLVRITEIAEDADGLLSIGAEGVPVGTASAALYAPHSSGPDRQPNAADAPGSVSTPALINAPTSLTNGDPEIWCAVASSSPAWGGCEIWVSADNVTYSRVGTVHGPARYGVLTAALANHADPDTTNTLAVDLTASRGDLGSATAAEADAGGSLCIVGDELVTYQSAILTGANAYNLTMLHRGFAGTLPASHAVGQRFIRLDDAVFKFSYASLNVGSTIYVKFPSFNILGQEIEDLSTLSPYTVSLAPSTALPDSVTGLALAHAWDGSSLSVVCEPSARAVTYKFRFYLADRTTLKREIVTSTPAATYTSALAAQDGVSRVYHIEVISSNAAGDAPPSSWLVVANNAPPAVSSPAAIGGTTNGTMTCAASADPDLAGYVMFYSSTSGFNPSTSGGVLSAGIPSITVYGLAAGTYFGRIAAYDGWTADPAFLNLSAEQTFTISTGGGSSPSGGGDGGGGYDGRCVIDSALILMADAERSGPGIQKPASAVDVGDWVWTQHEITQAWGAYPVTAISFSLDPVFVAEGYPKATPRHRFWRDRWVMMEEIGVAAGEARVAKITVGDAHTYVSDGVLSHNYKVQPTL